jgi:hypothetical protein
MHFRVPYHYLTPGAGNFCGRVFPSGDAEGADFVRWAVRRPGAQLSAGPWGPRKGSVWL